MQFAKHWAATLDDYAIDLAWSPDGTLLAAASAAGGITIFEAGSGLPAEALAKAGAVKHRLAGHAEGANALAWSAAGLLASGGQDGCVRLWDAATGKQTAEAKLGNAWVEHLAWQAGRVVPNAPDEERRIKDNPPYLFAAAGRKLVALRPDGSVAHTFPDAPKTISALAVRPDGGACAAACFGHVVVWDAATCSAQEFSYGNAIYALTWSPDGRWLVAGCHDNAVHLWAPAEELELHMSGYETRLKELSFSHDSRWLATGGGRDVCVWDCSGAGPEGREPQQLPQTARTTAVAFQRSHSLLATADGGGAFTLWAPTRKNPMVAEVKMPAPATKFAWTADDTLLAVGTEQGSIFVFKTG